jgi:hypothetical protein
MKTEILWKKFEGPPEVLGSLPLRLKVAGSPAMLKKAATRFSFPLATLTSKTAVRPCPPPPLWATLARDLMALAGACGLCSVVLACGPGRGTESSEVAPRPPERYVAPPGHERPPLVPDDWALSTHSSLVLRPQNLVLSLPQGDLWKPTTRRGTWSGLLHAPTESEVWIRHVSARRTITTEECEKEARLSWELLRDSSEADAERPLRAPADYGGALRVILAPEGGGRVEAFAVSVSRCLAVVFVTGTRPGYPERLRVFANEVLPNLRVPNISERAQIKRF